MSGELPSGWTACTLGDIVERIETGKSVKCDERPPQGAENGLVKISAVTWGEFDEQESKTLFDSSHLKPEEKIQLGDFLISRANTLELVGSCVMVKKISKNLYLSDKVLRLVLPDEAKSWLLVCLRSQAGRKQIESLATGNQLSMRNISQQALKEICIPLPPLAEQTRIAATLDELLAQVDTLKARIDGIPALLKRFRQSVLAAAVSGRLTEEWRALNPSLSPISVDDLKKVWADVYRSQGRKYKEADLRPGELGYPLPNSWVEAKVGEVFDVYVGATPSRENTEFWGGTIPWVSSSEVAFCRIKETRESITEAGYRSASTTIHPPGTVMLAMIGQGKTRGQPAILDIEACHNQNTAAIRVHPDYCISEYLYYYLYERYEETRRVGSGNNQQALNKKTVQSLPFPLPTLAEQTEIVRRVEQLFAFADQLEAKVNTAKTRIDRLTQSILAKAFHGELVPQDRNDEPASVLLARIQAQRANAPKARRGRRVGAD